MIRLGTIAWLLLVATSGYAMFQVKYEVSQLEDELTRVNRQIAADREATHVLNAEWSRLNQPSRLDDLAKRHLHLAPVAASQIGSIDALPRRVTGPAPGGVAAAPTPSNAPHITVAKLGNNR
ncbi:MAG TPA: hypothetical protein VET85_08795 [Stellaceae bacterium]|nr:hypothetical protein [Stellaceae bacterium]